MEARLSVPTIPNDYLAVILKASSMQKEVQQKHIMSHNTECCRLDVPNRG